MNGCTVFRRGHRQQHKQHKPRKQINQKIRKTPISPTFPKRVLEQDRVSQFTMSQNTTFTDSDLLFWYLQNRLSIICH